MIWVASFFVACESDLQMVNKIINPEEEPDFSGENATILYSDSAYLKVKVTTPIIERFISTKPPKTVFAKGVSALFYDKMQQVESDLRADWAMLDEDTEIWEAKGNVVIQQLNGDKLITEIIYWDQKQAVIYNTEYTKIFSEGTSYQCQNGIRAAQNFSWWRCLASAGEIEFEDTPVSPDSMSTDTLQVASPDYFYSPRSAERGVDSIVPVDTLQSLSSADTIPATESTDTLTVPHL